MSGISYPPPSENLPIFDSSVFTDSTTANLTPSTGLNYFLSYPTAQGTENLSKINVYGDSTFYENITLSGTSTAIVFGDGSSMDTASGGGSGDALLSGGTSSTPQTFTGYNEFDNANGRITLGNTTNTTKIKLEADSTQNNQLNIVGQMSIGNSANTNTVIINSDGTTNGQLDVNGSLLVSGAGYPVLISGYGDGSTNVYGLQVSGGGILVGNNGGSYTSSYYVQIACSDASDGILYVNGSLNVTGTYITLDSATFTYGSSQVSLNSDFECDDFTCGNINMGAQLTLTNTISSTPTSSTITQSSTVVETLIVDGNIQLSGGTNRYISLNYTGQPDITLEQNYTGNLQVSAPLEISPNLITYPGNTNTVAMNADPTTDNQLDILGNLNISGDFVGATSSGSPTVFTGYNQINGLITNGISCLQKIKGNVTYTSGQGSKWTFVIPTTYGFGFTFAFSTNFTPTAYTVVNNQVLTSQTNSCISGSGYACCQPYILSGTTYFAYLLGPIAFSGTTQLISQTTATTSGAVYTFQTNDNPNYYQTNNISMELYIYPQATI